PQLINLILSNTKPLASLAGKIVTGGMLDVQKALFAGQSGDTVAPTISLVRPTSGATLTGSSVTIEASASDNVAVSRVEFYDSTQLICSVSSGPYTCTWNTLPVPNGAHALWVKVYDTSGNVSSVSTQVTVSNLDAVGPTVSIASPTNGQVV